MIYIYILHIHVYMYCIYIYSQNAPSLTSLPKNIQNSLSCLKQTYFLRSRSRLRERSRLRSWRRKSTGSKHQLGENECSSKMFLGLQSTSLSLYLLCLSWIMSDLVPSGSAGTPDRPLSKPLRKVGALSGNLQDIWSDDHQDWITVSTGYGVSIFDWQLKPLQILNKANPLTWIIAWFFPMQKPRLQRKRNVIVTAPCQVLPCLCPSFLCLDPSLYPGPSPSPSPSGDPSPYPSPSLETFPSPCRDPGAPYDLPPAKAGWMNKLDSNAIHQVPYAIRFSRFSQQLYHKGCIR